VRIKLYTRQHATAVRAVGADEGLFTAEQHASVSEHEDTDGRFSSTESLISWYLSANWDKLGAVGFLINYLRSNSLHRVLSLGAGPCVLEHILRQGLSEDAVVVATDFDRYFIEHARRLLPNISAFTFDFFKDRPADLVKAAGVEFDVAVFFGSAYVLDDRGFVRLLSDLTGVGIKHVIDFHAGYLNLRAVTVNTPPGIALRRLLGRMPPASEYPGKFHGYGRSRSELRRLYRAAGLQIAAERTVGGYRYVAFCTARG
jgi:hypothetical protein